MATGAEHAARCVGAEKNVLSWPPEVRNMPNSYTAITKKEGDWWIGWVGEVPGVNCQERTEKELLVSLRVAL